MQKKKSLFKKINQSIIGEFSWHKPSWLKKIFSVFSGFYQNKKAFWGSIGFILIVGGSFIGYHFWKASQPKPMTVSVSGSVPAPKGFYQDAKPDLLNLYFGSSVAPLDQIGKKITDSIKIKPVIKGEWKFENESKIIFIPAEDWQVGTNYKVEFDKKLFRKNIFLERYDYEFLTNPIKLNITQAEFYTNPKDPSEKKVIFKVSSNYPLDPKAFESNIKIRTTQIIKGEEVLEDLPLTFNVFYNQWKSTAEIVSENILIPMESKKAVLTINSGVKSTILGQAFDTKTPLTKEVNIPSMYDYFRIEEVFLDYVEDEKMKSEQIILVRTSARAKSEDVAQFLEVYQLPKDKPATEFTQQVKNYYWEASLVGPDILNLSKKLNLTLIPSEKEYSKIHTFKYQAIPKYHLYVRIKKNLPAQGGYVLSKEYADTFPVREYPKLVRIMHEGSVLSVNGDKRINLITRDVERLRFKIGKVLPNQIQHLVSQTDANFSNPYFNNWYFSEENISNYYTEFQDVLIKESGKVNYSTFDFSQYINNAQEIEHGLFFLKVDSMLKNSNYTTGYSDSRFILITDLGLVVKQNQDNSSHVFVQSVSNSKPVTGAVVNVLATNGTVLTSAVTDKNGKADFSDLSLYDTPDKKPVAYLVSKGKDLSFIPYQSYDRELYLSQFDIGGVTEGNNDASLNAYLFSDRGIYRPGEKFHIGGIVKSKDWEKSIFNLPVEIVVYDSRGIKVIDENQKLSQEGLLEFSYQTLDHSPTGVYRIELYLAKSSRDKRKFLTSTTIKVEKFVPDKVKIHSEFENNKNLAWIKNNDLKAIVDLNFLFGSPAIDHLVKGNLYLTTWYPTFNDYPDYVFFNPDIDSNQSISSYSESLKDQSTDALGQAIFNINLNQFQNSSFKLSFLAEGFSSKEGGRSVHSQSSILVSNRDYLIGYRSDNKLFKLYQDSEATINYLAINQNLKPVEVNDLNLITLKEENVSVLTKTESGLYRYQTVKKDKLIDQQKISLNKSQNSFGLNTKKPGYYRLILKNSQEEEISSIRYYVRGEANLTQDLEKNSELKISLNKEEYAPGEEIEIQIESPYIGSGLISIEQDKVHAFKWFQTDKTHSLQTIKLPNNYEGNGYVEVLFVRDINSKEIYTSPLSYGVMPFKTELGKRKNKISLKVPEKIKPGEMLKIKYSSERQAKAIIFAVDQGILQVARYQSPKPLSHFFKKKALMVKTWQILDLILPEIDLIKELSQPGGDLEGEMLANNLNPFKRRVNKPAVFWSGIVDIYPDEKELEFEVPDTFNGGLKVMAVAVNESSLASYDDVVPVKSEVIIEPLTPLFVTPRDKFSLSVGLVYTGDDKENDKFEFLMSSNDSFQINGSHQFIFDPNVKTQQFYKIPLEVLDQLGDGRINFLVKKNDQIISKLSQSISIRPATHHQVKLQTGFIEDKKEISLRNSMYDNFRKQEIIASIDPLSQVNGMIEYLDQFPYQCTEQLISRFFPYLMMNTHPELIDQNFEDHLNQLMKVLQSRQNDIGEFGYWNANSYSDPIVNNYVLHFFIEAKAKNLPVPPELLDRTIGGVRNSLQFPSESLAGVRNNLYSLYLLTRLGYQMNSKLDELHQKLKKEYETKWEKDVAAIYLANAYQLMQKSELANDLITRLDWDDLIESDYHVFYDKLVRNSFYLYSIMNHFPALAEKISSQNIQNLIEPIYKNQFNTYSSGYLMMALTSYTKYQLTQKSNAEDIDLPYQELIKEVIDHKAQSLNFSDQLWSKASISIDADQLKLSPSKTPYFYQLIESGFDKEGPQEVRDDYIEIYREINKVSKDKKDEIIRAGDEVEVTLRFRSNKKGSLYNLVLIHLIPAGFETSIDSINNRFSEYTNAMPNYIDIREDRLLLFGNIHDRDQKFTFRMKAIMSGEFTLPAIYVESMYDADIKGWTKESRISIEDKI